MLRHAAAGRAGAAAACAARVAGGTARSGGADKRCASWVLGCCSAGGGSELPRRAERAWHVPWRPRAARRRLCWVGGVGWPKGVLRARGGVLRAGAGKFGHARGCGSADDGKQAVPARLRRCSCTRHGSCDGGPGAVARRRARRSSWAAYPRRRGRRGPGCSGRVSRRGRAGRGKRRQRAEARVAAPSRGSLVCQLARHRVCRGCGTGDAWSRVRPGAQLAHLCWHGGGVACVAGCGWMPGGNQQARRVEREACSHGAGRCWHAACGA